MEKPIEGTMAHPLTGPNGTCRVRHCTRRPTIIRVTATGVVVNYCATHERQAAELFGRD